MENQRKDISKVLKDMMNAQFQRSQGRETETDQCYFCADCAGGSLRKSEAERCERSGHIVMNPLKCSGMYGFQEQDLAKIRHILDTSQICRNVVNSKYIIYPRTRTVSNNKKQSKGKTTQYCVTCRFEFNTTCIRSGDRFCSIECQLMDVMKSSNAAAAANTEIENGKRKKDIGDSSTNKRQKKADDECPKENTNDENNVDFYSLNHRKKSRKGKPIRAPLF